MKKLSKMFWYVVMRFIMLIKSIVMLIVAVSLLLFCWVYSHTDLDYIMEWIDEHVDKRFRLFG